MTISTDHVFSFMFIGLRSVWARRRVLDVLVGYMGVPRS
nr:hypothetical protein JVH1_0277 [Rhodococcus sp. JVH1]